MSGIKQVSKIPAFDGFRGAGVLIVIFSHMPLVLESSVYNILWQANQATKIGYVALDIFFSISGFFITRLLLAEKVATGRISFKKFYTRRALRIFPIYYLTLLICFFVFSFNTSETASLLTYTFNIYHPLYPVPNPLEHTWSLSVEEQFYFFWPVLLASIPLRSATWVAGRFIPAAAILTGLAISLLTAWSDQTLSGNLIYMSPFTRMLSLSLGAWLAVREFEGRPFLGRPCFILALTAIVLLALDRAGRNAGIITSQGLYWTIALACYAMIGVAFTSTIVFDRGRAGDLLRRPLSNPILRGLGRISYGLYLYHLPVLFYFGLNDAVINGGKVQIARVFAAFAVTLALAIVSFYLIEQPLLSRRSRPARGWAETLLPLLQRAQSVLQLGITGLRSAVVGRP
jgi:peptidoglycan/LPS O-acetylase OafA/YrhL